jgi:hypothetical protein
MYVDSVKPQASSVVSLNKDQFVLNSIASFVV